MARVVREPRGEATAEHQRVLIEHVGIDKLAVACVTLVEDACQKHTTTQVLMLAPTNQDMH